MNIYDVMHRLIDATPLKSQAEVQDMHATVDATAQGYPSLEAARARQEAADQAQAVNEATLAQAAPAPEAEPEPVAEAPAEPSEPAPEATPEPEPAPETIDTPHGTLVWKGDHYEPA